MARSLQRVAQAAGSRIGAAAASFSQALEDCGYEPAAEPDGSTVLRNCPFHKLAQTHTAVVCGLNLELLTAVAAGAGAHDLAAVLDPGPGRCCVRILPEPPRPGGRAPGQAQAPSPHTAGPDPLGDPRD